MQNIHIAKTIKLLCKEKGIDIKDFLSECGFAKSFIYDMEKKGTSPSCKKITVIAEYFNCSVDYLLGRSDVVNISSNNNPQENSLTAHEELLLSEYRKQINMQLSVDKLLGIDNNAVEVLKIARGKNSEPVKFKSDISDLQNAHMTDEDF